MTRSIDGSGIDRVLSGAVEAGDVPHVVAIAADRDGVFYEGAAGVRSVGADETPVDTSSQFRIMSMTKMVATAAALQQVERGALELDAPVEEYCPQFADVQLLVGFDGDTPKLRQPATRATVRQLMTHTSGLSYWFWNADMVHFEAVTGVPNVVPGSARAFEAPLVSEPGSRFEYGINTDWLGRVVEAVAGQTLDVVVKEGITGPLSMDDTMFRLDPQRYGNCVAIHVRDEDGNWTSAGEILNQDPDYWAGGHGLYSTPLDYVRFERALLRGGELDGERILREDTVDAAFTNQIGDLDFPAEIVTADPPITDTLRVGPGWKWGYGLLLNTNDVPGGRRAGTGAWAGLFNTHFFVDRATGICASIYTNSLPFIPEHEAWKMYVDFEQALYAAL
ncbi:MAG: beta-lactamase family protein [Pseudonocardia sp.]|uniref:serine hydrolase domain-containing protein n=1 Tax=unclassified Pseudonocardia TaxID=2619320 RepID=UPI00086D828B|nr:MULTISPECIES: serine hydrolase domain-containing protein [unclassified Pseudonocardia]MBN9112924.1 beta-lactamase family protein [Pseudonocardia sp.]ODU21000.1 MAG: serine hydrolase [Pseudonocardia sp. SCN 72-51]ODV05657.1 MAG: serine hydrolase [Pseudonocardia sp. SCN 73-27]